MTPLTPAEIQAAIDAGPSTEIRDLNDALTAALQGRIGDETLADVMRRRYGREAQQWQANHDQRKAERDALQSQLDWFKSSPFVPRRDFDSLRTQLDDALRVQDALTAQLTSQSDKCANVALSEAERLLAAVMVTLRGVAGGPSETRAWRDARAWLAERGIGGVCEEHVEATARWQAVRK